MHSNHQDRVGHVCPALLRWAGLAGFVALLAGCGGGGTPPPSVEFARVLDSQWQARYPGAPGGLTAMLITPKAEFFASTIAGATPATHFRGASTTKTFTAAAIMLLDQRGQLRIDDLVTGPMPGSSEPYLPTSADYDIPNKNQITIRQLLGHRAGVFDVANDLIPPGVAAPYAGQLYRVWAEETKGEDHTSSIDELVGVVAIHQLVTDTPGAAFHYSNTGYSLLARIVERVSGKPYAQFIHDELVVPNGLAETTFPDAGNRHDLPTPFIEGTTKLGGVYHPTTSYNVSWAVGEGNIVTTPADLSRWMRRLLRGEAGVNATQLARMRECFPTGDPGNPSYGLGLECSPTEFGHGHNGAIQGYSTIARHEVATDVTMVIVNTLRDAGDGAGELAWLDETATRIRAVAGY